MEFTAPRVILIGNGQIGSALAARFSDVIVTHWKQDIDLLDETILKKDAPTHVINAAGKTDLAWCEANAGEAIRSNLEAPVRLYDRMLRHTEAVLIHFSSGCVWDGPYDGEGKPFEPDSPVSPQALYSWTKAACDAMLLQRNSERVAILRPRQVFSDSVSQRNTLSKLLKYERLIGTPQSMSSIAVIEKTVEVLLGAEPMPAGILNVYDKGEVTPFEVAAMLFEEGIRRIPRTMSKAELDEWHRPKRVDTVLHDARFEALVQPGDVREELDAAIKKLERKLSSD